jgi:hypothetical protein
VANAEAWVRIGRQARTLVVGVALLLAAAPPAAVRAATRPADLTVVAARATPPVADPTGRMTVSAAVANLGGARSGVADVQYVLARGLKPKAADLRLSALDRVAALGAGKRRAAVRRIAIVPPTARPGAYRVFACVVIRAPARERPAGNNCRLAGAVVVRPTLALTPTVAQPAEDRAVTATLDATGGTIEATAADGSVVRLVVPENALTGSLQIRLVPLAALSGPAPGATLVAGAALEPAGLLLSEPARLEVVPAPGGAAPALAASFDGTGEGAHLVPVVRRPSFAVLVDRFAGYAALTTPSPARTAGLAPLPASPARRIVHAIARLQLGRAARAAGARTPAAEETIVSEAEARLLAAAYYVDVVRPELLSLASSSRLDPERAIAAVRRLANLLTQLSVIGIDDALPDAYAKEASDLMQRIVRKTFDERLRRCKAGEVRSAVGMIAFIYRGGLNPSIGIPPYDEPLTGVLGEDWQSRGAVCLRLRFRFDVSTVNEWRLSGNDPQDSLVDAGWHDSTAAIEAHLDGYSESVGSPATALIAGWQQGTLLRWIGDGAMEVSDLKPLDRPHRDPPPTTCYEVGDARSFRYKNPQGTLKVEIVPVLESFDERAQRLDESGKLQVRYAELGLIDQYTFCPILGTETFDISYGVFGFLHAQRGDDGKFRQNRNDPTTIGRERWYKLPLQGGTQDLTDGGPIVAPGVDSGSSRWQVTGLFNVTVIPPG